MLTALRTELGALAADISVLDVDEDPLLLEKYDELVPVLTGRHDLGPVRELGHYFLDVDRLSQFIGAQP